MGAPALIMMAGFPFSRKSEFAKALRDMGGNFTVHSIGTMRKELLGDAFSQVEQTLVFQTLQERILHDLSEGNNVVCDVVNPSYKRRKGFLGQVRKLGGKSLCVFIANPFEKCLTANAERGCPIPEAALREMRLKFDIPMLCEGWDDIKILDGGMPGCLFSLIDRLWYFDQKTQRHRFSLGEHMSRADMYLDKHYPDADVVLRWAVILHDIGKEFTQTFVDYKGWATKNACYYGHERVGAYESFSYTGHLEDKERIAIATLIRWHMWWRVVQKSQNPTKTEAKLKNLIGEEMFSKLKILNECDRAAR